MLRTNTKSLENHIVSPEEEKERLQWEKFAEKEGFKKKPVSQIIDASHYAPAVRGHLAIQRICLSHGAAALGAQLPYAIGTLADCGPVRGRM